MVRVILHCDMDAFYASIEQRDKPELKGRPVIVGSAPTERGVVCAASYEARAFGVRSAMSSHAAAKLCPAGIFVRPRMDYYRKESQAIFELVRATQAVVEQVSVDEAYLDITQCLGIAVVEQDEALEVAVPIARTLQARVREVRGLTMSIGIASNKLLAKLGSDFRKPNGLTVILDRERVQFLRPLPCRALHGVGAVTSQSLAEAGIHSVGDLQDYAGDLRNVVGSFGPILRRFAFGEDSRPLDLDEVIKSISSETTFRQDTEDRPLLRRCLYEQSAEIGAKLRARGLAAQTIQVKVRYGDFSTLTRQISLEEPIQDHRDLYRMGCWLLARDRLVHRPLRLLGLGASGLVQLSAIQLTLPLQSGERT